MLEYVLTDEGAEIIRKDLCGRLREGQVGILPTDTVYGLVCLADNEAGRNRICQMKKREPAKPMQFLLGTVDHCRWLDIPVTPVLRQLADAFWPGPLTIVVSDRQQRLAGIRVPNHQFVRQLIAMLGRPLLASSANLSGEDPSKSYGQAFRDLNGEPDFVLLQGALSATASTVIHLHDDGAFELLRAGTITDGQLRDVLGR